MPVFNVSFRKVGGIFFWRVGRFGGSFYLQSAKCIEIEID